jgi:tetratricopeptide (TPR) repeat protein
VKRKPDLFIVAAIIMVLSANYLLFKNPIGYLVNLKDPWFGVGLFAGGILLVLMNFFAKRTYSKSYINYKPREIWLMAILVFVVGVISIVYSMVGKYFSDRLIIEELYINLIIQIFISALIIVAIRELYTYTYEYPVRKVLKVMDKAGQLIDNMKYKEALSEFDIVEKKLNCFKHPHIYGWIKQSKGLCCLELAKHEDRKKNLLLAVNEFEQILKLKELKAQHGQVKVDIGNIFYEIAEMDNNASYYENALNLFNDALIQYKLEKDFDGCMNALRNAERTKTALVLGKTS